MVLICEVQRFLYEEKKANYAEGGIRVPAFITGPNIPAGTTLPRTDIFHLTDITATIMDIAGISPSGKGLDGFSFKETFENGARPPRDELIHTMTMQGLGVYRKGDYKISYKF